MRYPRDEIWCRKAFQREIRGKELKVLFRPGNRVCSGKGGKCFFEGEVVRLRILKKPGDDERGIEPVFCRDVKKVRIKSLKVVDIDSLKKSDFEGSWPNVGSPKDLKYFFALLYNKFPSSFRRATKIELEYVK